MTYTDIFVIPVPANRMDEYRTLAATSADVWLGHGALTYSEVAADDVKSGKWTSFPQSLDLKDGEQVIVALITYRSRTERDAVNARAMADPRIAGMNPATMPFDAKRMFWGGFTSFVERAAPASAIQPYLFYRGRCEEAIAYYQRALGAELGVMMRFSDNPDQPEHAEVPAELQSRIMHADMKIAGAVLMLSDGMKTGPLDFACMSISLSLPREADCDRIFNALAKDGTVQMPIGPTFFAKRFGAVEDKFGVSWMIMVPPDA